MTNSLRVSLFWIVVFGLTLPAGVVLSTHLARRSFERVKLRGETVTVKGYAERRIIADRAAWGAEIIERNPDLAGAYAQLETHRLKLLEFLAGNGFKGDAVAQSPVRIRVQHTLNEHGQETHTVEGYVLSQTFAIGSDDVRLVARVARASSDLIRDGMQLESGDPEYLYTKLNEVKMEMLNEATANARQRAEQLVSHSTSRLGALRSANQGVFQITPAHSTEVSDEGINDTGSIEKIVKAVVTIEYALQE